MKKITFAFAIVSVIAACGGGGTDPIDDTPAPSSPDAGFVPTADAAPPLEACNQGAVPDPLTITGTVTDLIDDIVIEGATVTVRDGSTVIDSITTDASGVASFSIATGGEAFTGSITIEADGYLTTLVYPAAINRNLEEIPLPVLTPSQRDLGAILAGASIDETKGAIVSAFIDCDDMGVAGVSYSYSTDVETLYLSGDSVDPDATATDDSGIAIAFNVAPGPVTVTAAQGGTQSSVEVTAEADAITLAIFVP